MRFNGANTYLNVNLSSLSNSPYTIIAMEVASNKSSGSSYFIGTTGGNATDLTLHIGYNTPTEWRWGQYGDDLNYDTTFVFPTTRISTEKITAGLAETLYFNSKAVASRPGAGLLTGTNLSHGNVGRAIGGGNYQGDLAELIVYNTALSDADRTNVENYLSSKWSTGFTSAVTSNFNVLQSDGTVFQTGTHVVIPSLNTNEIFVASTTPQEYGAVGDGITDDSAAFQNAMNAVFNSGDSGGGVVYVPS